MRRLHNEPARCCAPPLDAPEDPVRTCGKPAVEVALVDGVECPLCAAHLEELRCERKTSPASD